MAYFAAIALLLALSAPIQADGSLGDLVYAPGHASADYYSYPRYAFEYAVRDPHTGDNKAQWEKRDGDVVIGAYSLVEPDGSLRVVEYRADDKTGFNAVVKRIGPNIHPIATPIYKASIPSLGYKSYMPQPIGRVAGLEKLANAPLYNRAYSGSPISGLLYKPIAPATIKEVVPITPLGKIIEATVSTPLLPYNTGIIPAPINKGPIIPELIYKGPIMPESIYKGPIIPESLYKGPIISAPIYKGPIIPTYKGPIIPAPINKGPIIPESIYKGPIIPAYKGPIIPEPIYKGPIISPPIYKGPIIPNYKGPIISEPIYKGPIISPPIYKEPIIPTYKGTIISEPIYKGPIISAPIYKGPIISAPIYKGPIIETYRGPMNSIYNVPIPQYPLYKTLIPQAPYRPALSPIPISKLEPLLRAPVNYTSVSNSMLGLPGLNNLDPTTYRDIDYSLLSKALMDYNRLLANKAALEYKDIQKYNSPLVYKGYTG